MRYDVVLLHAPSVYDFRKKDDVLFAYLANSDSVHVSGIFEMPPVGVLAIYQYLKKKGKKTAFFNLASHMLREPEFDADRFIKNLNAEIVGIDLHWLAHTQGALEVAKLYKQSHQDGKVFLGGISASQFHEDAIGYPQIDYVVRGNDTLEYVDMLVDAHGVYEKLEKIPNLTWKYGNQIMVNEPGIADKPYSATVDWKEILDTNPGVTPYNLVIPQYGCGYCCNWCGGSRYANKKEYGVNGAVEKTPDMLREELRSIIESKTDRHTVTMINYWHENDELLQAAEETFSSDKIDHVHISVRRLPDIKKIKKLPWHRKLIIELSPDSEQMELCRLCGHAHYSMEEMEAFIDGLQNEVYSFEIYFMIGLPNQTAVSVENTLDYCAHLLRKYKGKRVFPYICPMLPFLDKDSIFYDQAERFGYRIFHRTLEDYSNALLSMNWKNRLNYETDCLNRDELVAVTYGTVRKLTMLKAEYGILPKGMCNAIVNLIDETEDLLRRIDACEQMEKSPEKDKIGIALRKEIFAYNQRAFKNVRSQQRPMDFGFTSRQWFDTEGAFEEFEYII